MKKIKLIRAYNRSTLPAGYKILVDRLWPRGVSKSDLSYEWWIKELAPTDELRRWFNHEDEKYEEFKNRYILELENNFLSQPFLDYLKIVGEKENIILIYGAKNEKHNQAVVLKDWIENKI